MKYQIAKVLIVLVAWTVGILLGVLILKILGWV